MMFVSKWHMHRMGLVDFWYYENEEFMFKDGHMLLRGSNGSGKSVTMQSFIPLLLDGNKSSERLDSFGTRSRKIENYLIEEDGDRDDRIGYLYLEFKREDADVFKTIGMGLHARRNKPIDAWYFVIEDNRRINYDIQLMDHNLAITKQMLKNIIGTQLIDSQKEYMDRVNGALFGFPSRDDYKEAINLLMQLRSPKLSNSLKPTMINEILSNSLQPLSEEDLRPMSEAISNMDVLKDQLDALKQSYASAKIIANVYQQYNYAVLKSKVDAYLHEEKQVKTLQGEIAHIRSEKEKDIQNKDECVNLLGKLRMEQNVLEEEKSSLIQSDMTAMVEDVQRYKKDVHQQKGMLEQKRIQEDTKDNQRIDIKNKLDHSKDKKESLRYEIKKVFEQLDDIQQSIDFEEHFTLHQEVLDHLENKYDYSFTQKRIKEEIIALQRGLEYLKRIQDLEQRQKFNLDDKEKYQIDYENVEKRLNDYERMFGELQEEYKERFAHWNEQNAVLKLNREQMLSIIEMIQDFDQVDHYGKIDTLIHDEYFKVYKELSAGRTKEQHSLELLEEAILELQRSIDEWTYRKEPKPDMDDFMKENRKYLEKQGISVVPLYKMLDYSGDGDASACDRFEETLERMGLLNALLVHKDDKERVIQTGEGLADQYIFVDTPINELKVYEITAKSEEMVDIFQMLHSFGISSKQIKAYENYYENGILTGTISKKVESQFIGEVSRERYRQKKLAQLKEEIEDVKQQKDICVNNINDFSNQLSKLDIEYHNYPNKDDLIAGKLEIQTCTQEMQQIMRHIQEVEERIRKLDMELAKEHRSLMEIASKLGINAGFDVFHDRKENFEAYASTLQEIKEIHIQYINNNEVYLLYQQQFEDISIDVDVIREECRQLHQQIEKLEVLIHQKEQQLEQMGYADIKRRLEEIIARLSVLPDEISECDHKIGAYDTSIANKETAEQQKTKELTLQEKKQKEYVMRYENELKLQYVVPLENQDKVEHVLTYLKSYSESKRKDVLANDLQTSFYNHRGSLQEYNLSMISLFNDDEEAARLDITARYQGIKLSFTQLLHNLKEDIEKHSMLLVDSDRSLIEDILVNTISKKIRVHIQNSKRWVDNMNRYMNSMNTSSGLKLNLQWKSHKAENDDELNSEKLVELLQKDVKILKSSDIEKLSSHFRSKISTARKISEQKETHESFHQVMRNVMDYRTWFDFRIMYEKTGEKKKELTNNAFYAFSGGEKAMAMYVPLFSAVAAKFEGANEDAPLLIALDEAFAGVDEKNINNMFELIRKFKFDFIMNSQVLWGDYPSVNSLAIHELFRPENARFVTVISYEWNGHIKRLVHRS